MRRFSALLISLAFVLALAGMSASASQALNLEMDAAIPVSPKLSEKKLKNGLTYYVRSNSEPEKRARLMLVVKTGWLQEDDDQLGASHFVEHMAFNGTKNFPGKGIDRFMESVGMGTCECYSGYTTFTETVFSFALPTDDIKVLDKGLQVLSDIASEIVFDTEEVERERGVIVEEWREGKGRSLENSLKMQKILYKGSRYAERLSSNEKSPAEDLDRETLLEFYRSWYRPDLMAVIAVGDFDEEQVAKLIRKRFKLLKSPKDAPEWKKYDVPDRTETDYLVVTDPDTHTLSLSISNMHEWSQHKTIGDERRRTANSLFTSMLNYRLLERLFEKDPPYLSARVSSGRSVGQKASFTISISSEKEEMQKALNAVVYEIARAIQHGFTETELERNKASILKDADDIEKEGFKSNTSTLASELMRHFLEEEPVPGYENEVAITRGLIPLITLEEINSAGKDLIAKDNWLIFGSAPADGEALVPDKESILAKLESVDSVEVAEYVDKVSEDELMPVLPAPGEVVSVKKVERFGYEEWTLSNGATVVLKPTDFEETEVIFSAYSDGGHSLATDENYPTAVLAAPIVIGGGLGRFDALSLGKKLTDKSVSMAPYISELQEGFSGSSTTEDLETMFKLLHLYFTAPRKDEIVFDVIKNRLIMAIDIASKQPEKKLTDTFTEVMYNNHPRRVSLNEEMVAGIGLDGAIDFFRSRFADAGDFTFFLVGSFDMDRVKPLVETYIGGLPSIDRRETWRDIGVELPKGVIRREVRTGTEEKANVMIIFSGDFQWSMENYLDLHIASEALENMLTETLREEMSGTYDVSVSGSAEKEPRQTYGISVTFNCSPELVEQLTEAVFADINKLKEDADLEKYVKPIIKKKLQAFENSRKTNSYWLKLMLYIYGNGLDPEEYVLPEELLQQITAQRVAESARQHFDMDNYINIIYYSGT